MYGDHVMSKYLSLSWEQFAEDTHGLVRKLSDLDIKWTTIVAIARGGLVPAAIISHEMSIRSVDTICINSYDDETFQQQELEVLKGLQSDSQHILVIDDLVDTGKTFKMVRAMLPNAHYACVYAKPAGLATTDSHFKEVANDTWLVFPWEEQLETSLLAKAG
jgi:xanthine phosphoribosyltransferase